MGRGESVAPALVPSYLGRRPTAQVVPPGVPTKTDRTEEANRPAYPPRSNVPFVLGIAPAWRSSIRLAVSNALPKAL